MKKNEVIDAIVKMAVTKVEDAEGNMVPMTTRTMTVNFSDMTYSELKETFLEMMDEFMDKHGENKVPDEFGNLYNTLTDEPEGTESEPEEESVGEKVKENVEEKVIEERVTEEKVIPAEKKQRKRRRTKAEIEAEKKAKQVKQKSTPPVGPDPRDIAGERCDQHNLKKEPSVTISVGKVWLEISGTIEIAVKSDFKLEK